MRRPSSWSGSSLLLFLLVIQPASAATWLERDLDVAIGNDGRVVETHRQRLRLDTASDLDDYADVPIALDVHRTLQSVEAFTVLPDGRRLKVKRRDQDRMEVTAAGLLHSSSHYLVLSFPSLEVGAVLSMDVAVAVEPYYPAGYEVLGDTIPTERLSVRIRGGDTLRYRLDGPVDGLTVEELPDGVRVVGTGLAAVDPPDHAPGGASVVPILRYAWDSTASWAEVGAWYTELLAGVPRGGEDVRAQARELVAGLDDPRERLEALLAFLRRQVRYEAVEIGIGGYRPSPPSEVLARRWGDCKDKGLLLVDLLAEAGINAYPVLIRSGREYRIDTAFPAPSEFNHLIVAVPEEAVAARDGDPSSGGYLFLDPTQTRGSAGWLAPSDQDQDALVVRGGEGVLVRTPLRPENERVEMTVTLTVDDAGAGHGGAGLQIRGRLATGFVDEMEGAPPERSEETARSVIQRLLPGVEIGTVAWEVVEGGVPEVSLSAAVTLADLVQGEDPRRSFRLPSVRRAPNVDEEERDLPVVVSAGVSRTAWNVRLPDGWCRPRAAEKTVENNVGRFVQTVRHGEGNNVVVERQTDLHVRWVEPPELGALREVALAEARAEKRRLRLVCED